jgi:Ca2+-binding RTX toxin-like protein
VCSSDLDDKIDGGGGVGLVIGDDGDDVLDGGAGNDRLEAGFDNADDTLTGGTGSDTFEFGGANGQDSITDFTDGEDIIDLSVYADVNDVSDFDIEQQGADVVISNYGGIDNSIVVQDFDADDLSNEDFAFG